MSVFFGKSISYRRPKTPPTCGKADRRKNQQHAAAASHQFGVDDRFGQNRIEGLQRPRVGCNQADPFHQFGKQLAGKKTTADATENQDHRSAVGRDLLVRSDHG